MKTIATISEMRTAISGFRKAGETVGLVPTMGFLHEGHLSLVRRAKAICDRVVVSIFVNPTQFGPKEDLAKYPRDEARDLAMLGAEGVDAVFIPSVGEMYPAKGQTIVETTALSRVLIGRLRPGHFQGVATVVTKLLNIAQPDCAFFGEKDYQQLAVIRTMAQDLNMPFRIVGVPTVREADGLAMSSRNVRLTPENRLVAKVLFEALVQAQKLELTGASVKQIVSQVKAKLATVPQANVQSVDLRDAVTLAPIRGAIMRPVVLLLAVRFGDVLLIDNRVLNPS
jgi:pantoate--beta-alanine ligase